MTSAVINETARAWDFFGGVSPHGCSFVSKREHIAHDVLWAAVKLRLAFFVAEQPTTVVAQDFAYGEGPRDLDTSSSPRQVGYYFQAVPCLCRYLVLYFVQLQQQALVTSIYS